MNENKIKIGIQLKFFIIIFSIIIFICSTLVAFFITRARSELYKEIEKRGVTEAKSLAYDVKYGVLTDDEFILHDVIFGRINRHDIVYLEILRMDGSVLVESRDEEYSFMRRIEEKPTLIEDDVYKSSLFTENRVEVYEFTAPVMTGGILNPQMKRMFEDAIFLAGIDEDEEENSTIGKVKLGITLYNVNKKMNETIFGSVVIILIVVIAAISISHYFVKFIVKPIKEVSQAALEVSKGDLTVSVEVKSTDEVGLLEESFNKMTQDLRKITVSKAYVDNIFKSMTDTLTVINHDGLIDMVNQATLRLLGYAEDELVGKSISMILEPEAKGASGIDYLSKTDVISGAKKVYLSKNGNKIPVLFSSSAMRDEHGNVQGIVCLAQDITELERERKRLQTEIAARVKLEQALATEKERLSVTLRSIGDGVIATDNKGSIVFLNKEAEQLTGWSHEEAVGMPITEVFRIISERSRKTEQNPVAMVLKEEKIVKIADDTALIARNGKEISISDSAAPIQNNEGTIIGVVVVFRDVTERKVMEEEKEQMRVKMLSTSKLASLGEISTGVAHEINQPLTYISSSIQNLRIDIEDNCLDINTLKERLAISLKQVGRIDNIIQHLRTFGRYDDNDKQQVNVEVVLNNTLLLLEERIRLKNIKLTKKIESDMPPISGNSNQLEQVFINLFQNAIYAFKKNFDNAEIRIDISRSQSGDSVCVSFADNGIGIDKQNQDKIFEPFFTTKEVGKGTGLGLSIVYGIISEHGGAISCESDPGKGATFLITLPVSGC